LKNKEKLRDFNKILITCALCGITHTKINKSQHLKSDKPKKRLILKANQPLGEIVEYSLKVSGISTGDIITSIATARFKGILNIIFIYYLTIFLSLGKYIQCPIINSVRVMFLN
jgi:hypothetical protein